MVAIHTCQQNTLSNTLVKSPKITAKTNTTASVQGVKASPPPPTPLDNAITLLKKIASDRQTSQKAQDIQAAQALLFANDGSITGDFAQQSAGDCYFALRD